jgi:DNA-binding LytR/AlgR family response regulator
MNEPFKILIVEDEAIVALDLSMRLQSANYVVVGHATSGKEAEQLFRETSPDLVLMDINIAGELDGIETATRLKQIQDVPIIFLSALSQKDVLERAKSAQPAGYLVKPFNAESLFTSIEIAMYNFATLKMGEAPSQAQKPQVNKEQVLFYNEFFFIKDQGRFTKVAFRNLLFVEANDNYIKLMTKDKVISIRLSMQAFSEAVVHQHLVRVHRGFMINLQNMDSFSDEEITMGRHQIPIGRSYKDDFLKSLQFL